MRSFILSWNPDLQGTSASNSSCQRLWGSWYRRAGRSLGGGACRVGSGEDGGAYIWGSGRAHVKVLSWGVVLPEWDGMRAGRYGPVQGVGSRGVRLGGGTLC